MEYADAANLRCLIAVLHNPGIVSTSRTSLRVHQPLAESPCATYPTTIIARTIIGEAALAKHGSGKFNGAKLHAAG